MRLVAGCSSLSCVVCQNESDKPGKHKIKDEETKQQLSSSLGDTLCSMKVIINFRKVLCDILYLTDAAYYKYAH